MTIFVTCQWIVTLDSIRNSCDVLVRSCLITLIKCLKSHKSLGSIQRHLVRIWKCYPPANPLTGEGAGDVTASNNCGLSTPTYLWKTERSKIQTLLIWVTPLLGDTHSIYTAVVANLCGFWACKRVHYPILHLYFYDDQSVPLKLSSTWDVKIKKVSLPWLSTPKILTRCDWGRVVIKWALKDWNAKLPY